GGEAVAQTAPGGRPFGRNEGAPGGVERKQNRGAVLLIHQAYGAEQAGMAAGFLPMDVACGVTVGVVLATGSREKRGAGGGNFGVEVLTEPPQAGLEAGA